MMKFRAKSPCPCVLTESKVILAHQLVIHSSFACVLLWFELTNAIWLIFYRLLLDLLFCTILAIDCYTHTRERFIFKSTKNKNVRLVFPPKNMSLPIPAEKVIGRNTNIYLITDLSSEWFDIHRRTPHLSRWTKTFYWHRTIRFRQENKRITMSAPLKQKRRKLANMADVA